MTHLKLQKLQKGDYPPAHRLRLRVVAFLREPGQEVVL